MLELHDHGCKPEQAIQSIHCKFSSKQVADIGAPPIIDTAGPYPHPVQHVGRDIGPDKFQRVGPAPRPVDPGQSPVGVPGWEFLGDHSGYVVLVRIAGRLAPLLENVVIDAIRYDFIR